MKKIIEIIFCSLLFIPSAQAQWFLRAANVLRPFNNIAVKSSGGGIFFEQGRIWIAPRADGTVKINDQIFVSSDLGNSWTHVTVAPMMPMDWIMNISFSDKNFGAILSQQGSLYITNDGGITWKNGNSTGGDKIKVFSPTRYIVAGDGPIVTFDGGNNWKYPSYDLTLNLCTDNLGVLYSSGDNSLYISRDSGVTWIKKPEFYFHDTYTSATHTACYDSVIYLNNENDLQIASQKGLCQLYISTNGGLSFHSTLVSGNPYLTGTVACGKRGLAYCQTYNGMLMTTDYGTTWSDIGGPGGILDCVSFALINDSTIVALDSLGNVWMTTNANNHDLPRPTVHRPITSGFSLSDISSCDSSNGALKLQHSFCSPLIITKATTIIATSPQFFVSAVSLPDTITQTKTLTIPVRFNASKQIGTFTGGVRVSGFYLDEGDTIRIDTTIFFSASSKAVPPDLFAPKTGFIFDTVSTCKPPIDTTVTLINKGCDTLTITQGPGALSPEFKLISALTLPIKLAPGDSITLTFRFTPSGSGTYSTRPKFTATQQGLSQDVNLYLEGSGKQEGGVFSYSPKTFAFKSLSICAHDTASGFVTNVGCDSLGLDAAQIFGDADFKLTANSSQLTVKPGDTIAYNVYLNPAQKGLRKGFLVLTSHVNGNTRRDSIPFTTIVTDGTRILSSTVAAVDFGKISVCDNRDTLITLRNTGCDTLVITGVGGLGSGFGTNTKFPIIILPGKDTTLDFFTLLDTAGGKSVTTATLNFTGNSDNTLTPILLSRTFTASAHRDLGLYLDPTPKAGGDLSTVSYDIKESPGKPFSGAGIKKINFDLLYNTTLLNFTSAKSSANLSSSDGKSFVINNIPEIRSDANGILATIGFTVYLTTDSTTNIDLMNVLIDTTHLPCATLGFTAFGSARFDYNYLCGERSLAGFMKGILPMRIVAIRPNPAQDELVIDLNSASKQDANIEILNALGEIVYSSTKNIISGANSIHLDTKSLSSGVYLVRIGGASQSFVKVK